MLPASVCVVLHAAQHSLIRRNMCRLDMMKLAILMTAMAGSLARSDPFPSAKNTLAMAVSNGDVHRVGRHTLSVGKWIRKAADDTLDFTVDAGAKVAGEVARGATSGLTGGGGGGANTQFHWREAP